MSRTAVVTGGGSGMGLDICRHLANDGHRVAVLDLDGEAAEHAARELRDAGTETVACAADVSDRSSVDQSLDEVRSRARAGRDHGDERQRSRRSCRSPRSRGSSGTGCWRSISPARSTACRPRSRHALRRLGTDRDDRVIRRTDRLDPAGAHAAAKGGVIALTKTVARVRRRTAITANTIPPFCVDTPMLRARSRGRCSHPRGCRGGHPLGAHRDGRRHRRRVRLPLLGARELHHRPGHRRQRRGGAVSGGGRKRRTTRSFRFGVQAMAAETATAWR